MSSFCSLQDAYSNDKSSLDKLARELNNKRKNNKIINDFNFFSAQGGYSNSDKNISPHSESIESPSNDGIGSLVSSEDASYTSDNNLLSEISDDGSNFNIFPAKNNKNNDELSKDYQNNFNLEVSSESLSDFPQNVFRNGKKTKKNDPYKKLKEFFIICLFGLFTLFILDMICKNYH